MGAACDAGGSEKFLGDGSCGDAASSFTCRSPTAATVVKDAVFGKVREAGVARAEHMFQGGVGRWVVVFVGDENRDRSACGGALVDAGQNFGDVVFFAGRGERLSGCAAF